jgi:hypothetical protein
MNILGLAPFILKEERGFRKFRASTFMSIYSVAMLVIVLFGELQMIIWKGGLEELDNVYTFATMMKSSAYTISHSGFLFFTLLFRGKILNFLHMLLTFNSSTHKIFVSYCRNFNYVMAQVFVLVTIYCLFSILITLTFPALDLERACGYFSMTVSVLSVNVVTLLFVNLAVVLKGCFIRLNTCLCELVQCAGQDSVGLYRQISTVIHPQTLIEDNNKSDRPKIRIEHIRRGCDFLCDFVDLLNSVYSAHTLILLTFYVVIFIYDSYFGFVGVMDVKRGVFGRLAWVGFTFIESIVNAVSFTALIYFCSRTTCEVRRCIYFVVLPGESGYPT